MQKTNDIKGRTVQRKNIQENKEATRTEQTRHNKEKGLQENKKRRQHNQPFKFACQKNVEHKCSHDLVAFVGCSVGAMRRSLTRLRQSPGLLQMTEVDLLLAFPRTAKTGKGMQKQ